MYSITVMANIVSFIVVIFVAIAFITLTTIYFKAQKKILDNRLEDEPIRSEVRKQLNRTKKHYSSVAEADAYFAKKEKHSAALRKISSAFFILIYLVFFGIIIFSNLFSDNRHVWIGDIAMMTVKTESMASAYEGNGYLFDENGVADEKDRIPQFSFLTVSKNSEYVDSLQVGDIAAFTMKDETGEEITVIHRIVKIDRDENGEPLYTFRGDANALSMTEERSVSKDHIVGVSRSDAYRGIVNPFLGHFVSYLQSGTGIAMVTIAFLLIFIYSVLSEKLNKAYDLKYEELKRDELKIMFPEETEGGEV